METEFGFFSSLPDPAAFEVMITEYWHHMSGLPIGAGGPNSTAHDLTADLTVSRPAFSAASVASEKPLFSWINLVKWSFFSRQISNQ